MAGNKRWTSEEIGILKQKYGKVDNSILAQELGRNVDAIQCKASALNIQFKQNNFTNIQNYLIVLSEKIDNMTVKINNLTNLLSTIPKYNIGWTQEERRFVFENYDKMSSSEISIALNRSESAVRGVLYRFNLRKPENSELTTNQKEYITKNYENMNTKEIAENLFVPVRSVTRFVSAKRLRKNRKKSELLPSHKEYIIANYSKMKKNEIAKDLSIPFNEITRFVASIGLRKNKKKGEK